MTIRRVGRHHAILSLAAAALTAGAGPASAQERAGAATGEVPAAPVAEVGGPAKPFRIGAYRATIPDLAGPAGVAIDREGTIYVVERESSRIAVFDADGAPRRTFGAPGTAPGRLQSPQGLALDAEGAIYVADSGNHRIQVLTADGAPLRAWGIYGSEPGQFNEPSGIAVDAERVYVADLGNNRVQIFDHAGGLLHVFGGYGDGDGRFNRPVDVAVDAEGFVYVADADNNRIQRFDASGVFVKSWGDFGPFTGLMDEPRGVLVRDGEVYVSDTRNHRVQIFDREGEVLFRWGKHALELHQGEGMVHYPNHLAIAPSGDFAVVVESFENRAQIFDALPEGAPPANEAGPVATKRNQSHFGERLDAQDHLMTIAEPESHSVVLFDTSKAIPIVIGTFGERGKRFGQMIRASGLELDVDNRLLYLSDVATRRVQAYALDYDPANARRYDPGRAKFAKAFDLARLQEKLASEGIRWAIEPAAIERDADGDLYVVCPRNSMILVFDPAFNFLRAWGGYGTEPGRFRQPSDLAFSRSGETVFVVDSDNHRVQAFDRAGRFLSAWGEPGTGDGQFTRAFGVAAGGDGFVYVTDAAAHRVQKFEEDGTYVGQWGKLGVEHGALWKPKDIIQSVEGRLILIDQGNHRAQIFSPEGEWLVTFGTGRAYSSDDPARRRRPPEKDN